MTGASNNSKKRKIYGEEEDEEKQEEEAKMETFFALVRSMRETRERWINSRSGNDTDGKNTITARKEENRVDVWKPTFELEDFAEEDADQHQNLKPPTAESNNCAEKDDAEKGTIDLKLTL